MQVIALISRKGGSGKSTLACNLAVAGARARRNTALIDLDPQASSLDWSRVRRAAEPVVRAKRPRELAGTLAALESAAADLVVLDTPGRLAGGAEAAAQAADFVLIPCRPGLFDLAAIATNCEIVKAARVSAAVVLNDCHVRSTLIAQARVAVAEYGLPVAPVVHNRVAHDDAARQGLGVLELEPGGKAAAEIRALFAWVTKQMGADP